MKKQILQHLQDYLLGIDKGFAFEAGPKRILIDGDQYNIDKLFYNYILKCSVLLDLHIGELTQQSLEKMQRCVNYYAREAIKNSDNPPIGIVLCLDKNYLVVKYILSDGNSRLVDSHYMDCIPSENDFKLMIKQFLDGKE